MNDNISIKKLWYDEDFYEVQIIMSTEQIHCKINTYIVDEEINALSQKILDYVKNDIGFYWEIGEEDSDSCPKIHNILYHRISYKRYIRTYCVKRIMSVTIN